jgi:hypothetical protein
MRWNGSGLQSGLNEHSLIWERNDLVNITYYAISKVYTCTVVLQVLLWIFSRVTVSVSLLS